MEAPKGRPAAAAAALSNFFYQLHKLRRQLENFGSCAPAQTAGKLHKKSMSWVQKFCYFTYSKNS
jgi:hypothetical protein